MSATTTTTQTMRALRFHGKRDIRIDQVPVPVCGKGQVKVKPAFVGICGTDLHEYLGGPSLCPTTPHPITKEQVPLTFGHEFSGVVEEVGDGVNDIKVGMKVCIQPIIYDGDCGACKEGHINCCWQNGFIGLSGHGGGLSEHIVVPRDAVFILPENVSLEVGALVEPLAVGWHAVNLSGIQSHETALILGGGPIGLSVIQALKARNVSNLIVSEVARQRKTFAKSFGAHHVLDPTIDDIPTRCKELCDGQGVHFVFDAAGVQAAIKPACLAMRVRGTMVNIAVWEADMVITPNDWVFKERRWISVATYEAGDFQDVINAISSGKINPADMITLKIKMEEIEDKGFRNLVENKSDHVKILVEVD